jgi:hypothetical protein
MPSNLNRWTARLLTVPALLGNPLLPAHTGLEAPNLKLADAGTMSA